jgi:predicted nucleotide-binding protein
MAQRKNQYDAEKVVKLNISHEEFKSKLNDRIRHGEVLFSRPIKSDSEFSLLENDVHIWNDYNFEMLKQVFNYSDNDYMDQYNHAGYTMLGQIGEVPNDPVLTKKNLINYKLKELKALLNKADLIKSDFTAGLLYEKKNIQRSKNQVFIVHGHDELAKTKTARFIERLGFQPIILHEQSSSGKTIIEKIEEYSNVGFGIILYTPCDMGYKKGNEKELRPRARQNVVFEHGFLIGKIGRSNVCALVTDDVETPTDISGVVYIKMDEDDSWHFKLAKEMRSSGYEIDLNKL